VEINQAGGKRYGAIIRREFVRSELGAVEIFSATLTWQRIK
jgi:hypothetical protein